MMPSAVRTLPNILFWSYYFYLYISCSLNGAWIKSGIVELTLNIPSIYEKENLLSEVSFDKKKTGILTLEFGFLSIQIYKGENIIVIFLISYFIYPPLNFGSSYCLLMIVVNKSRYC